MAFALLLLKASGDAMKKFNFYTLLKFSAMLMAIVSLSACGSTVSSIGFGSANSASTAPTDPSSAIAKCSKDMSGLSDFQIRVEAAFDSFGTLRPDYVRVSIVTSPSNWSSSDYDLQFYRWTATSNGTSTSTSLDSSALGLQFERTLGPNYYQLLSNNSGVAPVYTIINASEIKSYGQAAGLSSYSTPKAVLDQAHFLVNLRDRSGAFQVIRAVLYQKNTRTVVRQVDALIPQFYANPATYNAQLNSTGNLAHPTVLQALHPLKAYIGQGWSESQYQSFMDGFCF
jgi:hypothetical protein